MAARTGSYRGAALEHVSRATVEDMRRWGMSHHDILMLSVMPEHERLERLSDIFVRHIMKNIE